jgi:hypothetical protein
VPDQFGNPTGADVMAAMIGERDERLARARTPTEARLARVRETVMGMDASRDPRLTQARRLADALRPGQSLTRLEDESDLDFQIRQGRQMFEDVKDIDPDTAAKISTQLTNLEGERMSRRLLQIQTEGQERAMADEDRRRDREAKLDETLYEVDIINGRTTGRSVSRLDPDFEDRRRTALQAGRTFLTWEEASSLIPDVSSMMGDWWNKSTYDARLNAINAQAANVETGKELARVIADSIEQFGDVPTTNWDSVERGLIGLGAGLADIKRSVLDPQTGEPRSTGGLPQPGDELYESSREQVRNWIDRDGGLPQALLQRGMNSARAESLITTMAYVLARSFDARVTEQDYINARRIIGASGGNPVLILSAIDQVLMTQSRQVVNNFSDEINTVLNSPNVSNVNKEQAGVLRGRLGALQAGLETYTQQTQRVMDMAGPRRAPVANSGRPFDEFEE